MACSINHWLHVYMILRRSLKCESNEDFPSDVQKAGHTVFYDLPPNLKTLYEAHDLMDPRNPCTTQRAVGSVGQMRGRRSHKTVLDEQMPQDPIEDVRMSNATSQSDKTVGGCCPPSPAVDSDRVLEFQSCLKHANYKVTTFYLYYTQWKK